MYDIKETYRAHSIEEALALLEGHPGAVLVNGGTDVMIRMKEGKLTDAVLISIMDVPEIIGISLRENGDIAIGAGTCFQDIYHNEVIRGAVPALAHAANQVGSPQIRHVATIGGNLCNGAVSADSVPILLAMNAELELAGDQRTRRVALTQFHTGPGKTVLQKGRELLTAIVIPKEEYAGRYGSYIKFGQRNAMEIATLGAAVCLKLQANKTRLEDIRIAFSVAGPTPLRCAKTEAALKGMALTGDMVKALRQGVIQEVQPRDSWRASKQLRLQLVKELGERALRQAAEEAGGTIHD